MQRTLFLSFLLLFTINANAQQWLWAKRGGNPTGADGAYDIALDKWGNIYVAGNADKTNYDIDGQAISFSSSSGVNDIIVTSFRCDGSYRWSKTIDAGTQEQIWNIGVDKIGGVYLCGNANGRFDVGSPSLIHIDSDTEPSDSSQSIILIKLDTAGNYQWLRKPQPQIAATNTFTYSFIYDMDVDSTGTVRAFCKLPSGTYGGSYIAADSGMHQLQYEANGNFISGFRFDMDAQQNAYPQLWMRRDHTIDRYYLTGAARSSCRPRCPRWW